VISAGQFVIYGEAMLIKNPERQLYFALRDEVYAEIFAQPEGERCASAAILVFNAQMRR
jgi:XisH protein